MNKLKQLLNDSEAQKPAEAEALKQKPSAATSKANSLAAQETTLASACVGSPLFRSPKDFLADVPRAKGYKDEVISASVASKN